MHRALGIPELVDLICAQLGTEGPGGLLGNDVAHALSAFSRTSKMFCNPALNVLWRRQDTILNLLRCMPDDLWDIEESAEIADTEESDYMEGTTAVTIVNVFSHSSQNPHRFTVASPTGHIPDGLGSPTILYASCQALQSGHGRFLRHA